MLKDFACRPSQEERDRPPPLRLQLLSVEVCMKLLQALPLSNTHNTELGTASKSLALQPGLEPLRNVWILTIYEKVALIGVACPEEGKVEEIVGVFKAKLVEVLADLPSRELPRDVAHHERGGPRISAAVKKRLLLQIEHPPEIRRSQGLRVMTSIVHLWQLLPALVMRVLLRTEQVAQLHLAGHW